MIKKIPTEIATYYQSAPLPHRKTMLEMRSRILQVIPRAEEVVSYGMPAFKVNGSVVAGLLANKKHVGYYPFSGSVLTNFKKELESYSHTKSAIHIPPDQPLSKSLISKLIKARISQCPVKQGKVDVSKYEKLDKVWRDLGLAAPARRALVDSKIIKLSDFRRITELELAELHGMGPSAISSIKSEMKKQKISFKK